MQKWIMLFVVLMLATGTALADVSNEVLVGLEADSVSKAKDRTGADITSNIENNNSLFVLQYTHFFHPLKDDNTPIDLRMFYQHPSSISVGLAFIGATEKDTTLPTDFKTSASVLQLGGELHLPTDTAFFAAIGAGSGTTKDNLGGPETDLKLGQLELGARQYIGRTFAIQLRLAGDSEEETLGGGTSIKDDKSVAYLGAKWVIADVVGLALELGKGTRELKASGVSAKFDVSVVNAEVAGYIGKQFSVRLAVRAESEDVQGVPTGAVHPTTVTGRSTIAARYWFSESFGMELPIFSEKVEHKTVFPGGEFKDEVTNGGIGLYASFRF